MKKIRLAVGGISIILFCVVLFEAFSTGLFTFLTGGDRTGFAALLLAVMLFLGGVLGIFMRNNELGGVIAGVLFAIGCLSAACVSGEHPTMLIWAGCCLVFAAVMFVTSAFMRMQRPLTQDEMINLKTDFRHSPMFPVLIAMLLVLVACVLICGGESRSRQSGQTEAAEAAASLDTAEGTDAAQTAASAEADGASEGEATTVEEQLLYDENQVKITATGMEKNAGGYTVSLLIENNSILNLGFNAHAYAINGIMSRNNIYEMDCSVESGKKTNVEMTIRASLLTDYGISEIRCLDVLFWAYDKKSYMQAFTTGQLEIQTSQYDGEHDTLACRTFYDSDGISVGLVTAAEDSCQFCITNRTGEYLDFDFSDLAINGILVDAIDNSLLDNTLLNDCQILCTVPISDDFRRNNAIDALESMQWSMLLRTGDAAETETTAGPVVYRADSEAQLSGGTVLQNPFTDVSPDAYYYDAVLWAVGDGISSGVSDNRFGPELECTRAQMVCFLWRLAGSPKPNSNTSPFTDVLPGSGTYDAILWAWEQGISSGVTETTFLPDATITRAQAVTMLWAYAGRPDVAEQTGSFMDVTDATAYYYQAVLWANQQGIASGKTENEFAPGDVCSRAQVITFLYRLQNVVG